MIWAQILPHIQAVLNGTALVALIAGFFAIRNRQKIIHQRYMFIALITSLLFLVAYVIYHLVAGWTGFSGTGPIRTLFFTILISHVLMAVVLVPMIVVTIKRAMQQQFAQHRALAGKTLLVWIYVSVTGLIIYWMSYA
ncbi:MAG: DUF420 domain-containing protein [Magnetococcales bacterium]|nr:DUF420 domain-containing protein [Magnetococcales bacterium]